MFFIQHSYPKRKRRKTRRGKRQRKGCAAKNAELTANIQPEVKSIVNLSHRTLTETEKDVLRKGLGYIPSNADNLFNVEVDLFKFIRALKLRVHFNASGAKGGSGRIEIQSNKDLEMIKRKLGLKSSFVPSYTPKCIEMFEFMVKQDLTKLMDNSTKKFNNGNMSKEEQRALMDLKS
uniref:Uncharacterized protein n=1 Tax=Xenopus tropicalis TaxID=8364 RepID=A0A1B8Y1B2_XENTR